MSPLVSIIVPTYNRLSYLRAAIDSVWAQTFKSWELIIADDGSDEQTRGYLRTLESLPAVKVLWLSHSGNPGLVRNAALRIAGGHFVAFLDSDDLWMPAKLEVQVAALQSASDSHWSYTDHVRIDSAGHSINFERNPNRTLPDGWIVVQLLRLQAGTPTPTILAERALIERAGAFDEQQGLHEDYDLWLRMAFLSKVLVVKEALSCVRRHVDHFSSGGVRNFEARLRVLAKMRGVMAGLPELSILNSERARNAGGLAAAYAAADNGVGVWAAIRASWSYSWRNIRWYVVCVRALARVYTPHWLLMFVRHARGG